MGISLDLSSLKYFMCQLLETLFIMPFVIKTFLAFIVKYVFLCFHSFKVS